MVGTIMSSITSMELDVVRGWFKEIEKFNDYQEPDGVKKWFEEEAGLVYEERGDKANFESLQAKFVSLYIASKNKFLEEATNEIYDLDPKSEIMKEDYFKQRYNQLIQRMLKEKLWDKWEDTQKSPNTDVEEKESQMLREELHKLPTAKDLQVFQAMVYRKLITQDLSSKILNESADVQKWFQKHAYDSVLIEKWFRDAGYVDPSKVDKWFRDAGYVEPNFGEKFQSSISAIEKEVVNFFGLETTEKEAKEQSENQKLRTRLDALYELPHASSIEKNTIPSEEELNARFIALKG